MMSDVVRIVKCFVYGIGTEKHIAKHVTEWKAVLCGSNRIRECAEHTAITVATRAAARRNV